MWSLHGASCVFSTVLRVIHVVACIRSLFNCCLSHIALYVFNNWLTIIKWSLFGLFILWSLWVELLSIFSSQYFFANFFIILVWYAYLCLGLLYFIILFSCSRNYETSLYSDKITFQFYLQYIKVLFSLYHTRKINCNSPSLHEVVCHWVSDLRFPKLL